MNTKLNKRIPHNKPTIGDEEVNAVIDSLYNLELTEGTKIREFENVFSKYIGRDSVAVSSGTSALHLALIALGVSTRDEVILPAYTCVTVALPILYQRAKPILADVQDDYNISVDDIKNKITDKTKAVIVPHMFGYPADINEIKELCNENDIYLIEDCAQSIGAEYQRHKVGTFGDISIFSFYATKMITTIQGGMICTNNSEWVKTFNDLREPDQYREIDYELDDRLKYRYTMSDIGATMGIIQLDKLNTFVNRRRKISAIYSDTLSDTIMHPMEEKGRKHVFSRYIVRTSFKPNIIIEKLQHENISCAMMHMPPLNKRASIEKYNLNKEFPKTNEIVESAVSLPMYSSLTYDDALFVAETLNKAIIK